MIAFPADQNPTTTAWQTEFLQLLPVIDQKLRQAFAGRDPAALEDAVADGIFIGMMSFRRLHIRGKGGAITGANLAWFAAKQIRGGRASENSLNSHEPLSRYAQRRHGLKRRQLGDGEPQDREWIDALTRGIRVSIIDQVATRMDFAAWHMALGRRYRQIATHLAHGEATSEVARKFGVTAGRISQVRRELAESWAKFQGESCIGAT